MIALVVTWIANSLAIYAVGYLMRGVEVASFQDALIAGAVLSLINMIVKPVLVILTLPLTVITLGFFYFIISAFCLWLTAELLSGFMIHGFFTTIVAAILVSVFSAVIHRALSKSV